MLTAEVEFNYNAELAQICLECPEAKCHAGKCKRYADEVKRIRHNASEKSVKPRTYTTGRTYAFNGEEHTLEVWSGILNIPQKVLYQRMWKGMSVYQAFSKPYIHAATILLTHNGETHTLRDWSNMLNIPETTLRWRLDKGWSPEETLSRPVRKHK